MERIASTTKSVKADTLQSVCNISKDRLITVIKKGGRFEHFMEPVEILRRTE